MPEIRECFIHYKHAHHVLVEKLKLGSDTSINWTLRGLWADATQAESGEGKKRRRLAAGLTILHAKGYVDKIAANCKIVRGQKSHQTRIWPESLYSADGSMEHALVALRSLVLKGISYTPRSLILKFGTSDLQVSSTCDSTHQERIVTQYEQNISDCMAYAFITPVF